MNGLLAGIWEEQFGITPVPSNIDVTKPTEGMALTADVRANFQAAFNEITALQSNVQDLQARVTALEAAVSGILTANVTVTNRGVV
jgi:hypothetical protein